MSKFTGKNLISYTKSNISYIVCFMIGLIMGYILGWLRLHSIIADEWQKLSIHITESINNAWHCFIEWIVNFTPNTSFLSDIIAFQSAVVAIAIPLSLDIISRISERYNSEVIIQQFNKQRQINTLRIFLIINIVATITLKFFVDPTKTISGFWKILIWLIFFIFIITAILLRSFFIILRRYSTDTQFLLTRLYKDIDISLTIPKVNNTLSSKKIEYRQDTLIKAIEGIGDILIFEAKNKKGNKTVIEGLDKIEKVINKLLDIKKNDTDLFEQLLLSTEFKKLSSRDSASAQWLFFFPSKEKPPLITVTTISNQFQRIHEAASEANNLELARYPVWSFINILIELTQIQNDKNELLIKEFFENLTRIRYLDLKKQNISSSYYSSISWYTNVVFNRQKIFDIYYLSLLDEYFWESIKFIIEQNKIEIFEILVSTSIQGIHVSSFPDNFNILYYSNICGGYEVFKQLDQEYKLENKIYKIREKSAVIYSKQELERWLKDYNEINNIIHSSLQESYSENFKKIKQDIITYVKDTFKYKNLQMIAFWMAAYCLFKKQYSYINYLWNYNQPSDSDALWLNSDITPSTLEGVVYFFFKSQVLHKNLRWSDHHGSSKYLKQYFILLLLRALFKETEPRLSEKINSYSIPQILDNDRLFEIKNSLDYYIIIAQDLMKEREIFCSLNFDCDKVDTYLNSGVIAFLNQLKIKIDNQLTMLRRKAIISKLRVDNFEKEVIQSLEEEISIKAILKDFNLCTDRFYQLRQNSSNSSNIVDIVIKKIIEKDWFIENWYINAFEPSNSLGKQYGEGIVRGENNYILEKIIKAVDNSSLYKTVVETFLDCRLAIINGFESLVFWLLLANIFQKCDVQNSLLSTILDNYLKILSGNLDNVFILKLNTHLYHYIKDNNKFKTDKFNKKGDSNSFVGAYIYQNHEIPVFALSTYNCQEEESHFGALTILKGTEILVDWLLLGMILQGWAAPSQEAVLILNATKLGTLVQYSFLPENNQSPQSSNIVNINVTSLSENKEALNNLIQESSDWLQQQGNLQEQTDYLEQRVLIEISEKIEFIQDQYFEGYKIILSDNV